MKSVPSFAAPFVALALLYLGTTACGSTSANEVTCADFLRMSATAKVHVVNRIPKPNIWSELGAEPSTVVEAVTNICQQAPGDSALKNLVPARGN